MIHPRLPIAILLMFSMLLLAGLAACGEAATPVPSHRGAHGHPCPSGANAPPQRRSPLNPRRL